MYWLIVAAPFAPIVLSTAMKELREPATLGDVIRKNGRGMVSTALVMAGFVLAIYMIIASLVSRTEARATGELEFATGLTQALERVASMRGDGTAPLQGWSGSDPDGSSYAILMDGAGPMVRVENMSGRACSVALGYLSPYAISVLAMRDEGGTVRLDGKGRACPDGDARTQAVFRATN